jgi:hypothetical protein
MGLWFIPAPERVQNKVNLFFFVVSKPLFILLYGEGWKRGCPWISGCHRIRSEAPPPGTQEYEADTPVCI